LAASVDVHPQQHGALFATAVRVARVARGGLLDGVGEGRRPCGGGDGGRFRSRRGESRRGLRPSHIRPTPEGVFLLFQALFGFLDLGRDAAALAGRQRRGQGFEHLAGQRRQAGLGAVEVGVVALVPPQGEEREQAQDEGQGGG